jgi:hypothetical protein
MGAAVPMLVIRMELLEKNQAPKQKQKKTTPSIFCGSGARGK